MPRPSGTVTFLFTDVEGSTRRWETDPHEMREALATHDVALRSAIEGHGGWLFKHTGDGVCAAFGSARAAVKAAVAAQHRLLLPVRMGLATGEAIEDDGDYFGPVLNRAARVMAAGHGGQIVVEALTAALVGDVDMIDLGEHRLRDLSGATRLFQVRAEGLGLDFPPLRTVSSVPGNLPVQATSFVGRELEVAALVDLVGAHRFVTLTGVGGVGKTRLAMQVGAALVDKFPDGVWLVELAPVGDPAAVPEAVAAVLGVQAGGSAASLAQALSGRRLLIVLDNCEHVLDAAAALVETILARAATVKVLATSREGLRVGSEHLWAVPSLETAGANSAAVELFVDRAQAVVSGFSLHDERETTAVVELCRRLDGIALAIELAAARMVSMSPAEVLERLADRFRLLAGSRRGVERHQTLRQAVEWSYDLLGRDERAVLSACAVFADGFDLLAATHVCGLALDDFVVLDLLDSLVRKSLLIAEQVGERTRYRMLETIRQYGEAQLADGSAEVRNRHAGYFADQAVAHWQLWYGPRQREALDWVDTEFANLRAGFRWAADYGDIATATKIAAHTALLAWTLQRYEPIAWAEELLTAASEANLAQLPRLYTAASICGFIGRPADGLAYARAALRLEAQHVYDPFEPGWSAFLEGCAFRFSGEAQQCLDVCADLAAQTGFARVLGRALTLYVLPNADRAAEARTVADDTATAARAYGNPWTIAFTIDAYGRAFAETEPIRALILLRQGLEYTREHRLPLFEVFFARDVAALEAVHGEFGQALALFDSNIDSLHRAGDVAHLSSTLANLAVLFDRISQPDIAATLYGATTRHATMTRVANLPAVVDHLRDVLGHTAFDQCLAAGAAMEVVDVVQYARRHIQLARRVKDHPRPDGVQGPDSPRTAEVHPT